MKRWCKACIMHVKAYAAQGAKLQTYWTLMHLSVQKVSVCDRISCTLPFLGFQLISFFPVFICHVISWQLKAADRAGIVSLQPRRQTVWVVHMTAVAGHNLDLIPNLQVLPANTSTMRNSRATSGGECKHPLQCVRAMLLQLVSHGTAWSLRQTSSPASCDACANRSADSKPKLVRLRQNLAPCDAAQSCREGQDAVSLSPVSIVTPGCMKLTCRQRTACHPRPAAAPVPHSAAP